ncbi:MAG: cell division ATP-binding protein FtsE [SAR324 cluster bacterium]|uniref:Cell division ATP-binding protein FtsE n=1 Tax=SAR324 cluster bacterium TaxID=2024889 RepID=A0A2A4T5B6_9DELT|nr:MAG: cell division ATP-binding protein FtsE [SAR324 cluster bacterium]
MPFVKSVNPKIIVQLEKVTKSYLGKQPLFQDLDLIVERGEFLFLTGISGAGKSTIFRLLLGLEKANKGQVFFRGQSVGAIDLRDMPQHRRSIGMIFQDYKLLERKTVEENIAVPLKISGEPSLMIEEKIYKISKKLQIEYLLKQKILSLSGGEQQLVAIARAAIHMPQIILADEPTANLDHKTAQKILEVLQDLNSTGMTVIIATHDIQLIKSLKTRILLIKNAGLIEVR